MNDQMRSIESAPTTGEHFLAINYSGDWGVICGKQFYPSAVVHYWANPGEEGFYPSLGPDEPFKFTHWMPLP